VEIWLGVRLNKIPGCEPGEMFEEGTNQGDLWLSRARTICRREKGKMKRATEALKFRSTHTHTHARARTASVDDLQERERERERERE
jgi:hypothetical protein